MALALPIKVNLNRLGKSNPEMAHLWELTGEVTTRLFGKKDIFQDLPDQEDLELQRSAEALVPELISGAYDSGLRLAVSGIDVSWRSPTFRSLLANYRGPISATEAKAALVPRLINAEMYRFDRFVPALYPPLALQARIQGRVALRLSIDSTTGQVIGAASISGNPLLTASAIDAAKQWRFPTNSAPAKLDIEIDYSLDCH